MLQTPSLASHFTGAGISVRSFTRPQRRFHAISESMLPSLHLRFPAEYLRGSVRYQAPSLRSVSRPTRGVILAQYPFPALVSGALVSSASLRSPLGTLAPSGSKRSTGIHHVKLVLPGFDFRLLPAAISFDFAPAQRSRSAAPCLTYRSVNPGTEVIMHLEHLLRQMKISTFCEVSTVFCNVAFQ